MKLTPTGKFTYKIFPLSADTRIEVSPEDLEQIKKKECCFNSDLTAVIPYVKTAEENEAEYKTAVVFEIRKRYSVDDEIAVLRQKEEKPLEYKAYFDYCEECKTLAKGGQTM